MSNGGGAGLKLGVNGFGRIGKLTVWHHVARKYFDEIIINIGRQAGTSIKDIAHYIERDSTYGRLQRYLYGHSAQSLISDLDEESSTMLVDGVKVRFLRNHRNPTDINWEDYGVRLVVETTGNFVDPTLPYDHPQGSVRGHFESGVEKVIISAPFKIKDKRNEMPDDAVTTVMGVNDSSYDPRRHKLISNASCTTVCLAHMFNPLLKYFGVSKILIASMATIHAFTGKQAVLDRLPKAGVKDLRKNRSIMNNIILTSTGAADALRLVIPEMEQIGFIAESVRIPTCTGSLIILVLNIQEDLSGEPIRRELINSIYAHAASEDPNGYLHYTEEQNVSGDIIGMPKAAAIIEGHETHSRTAEVTIDLANIPGIDTGIITALKGSVVRVPVTQVVVYGWYDNEMGSYTNILGDRTVAVAENL